MDRSALIRKIQIRMDELTPIGENITHPFENSINSILDESHRQLLSECPVHLLTVKDISEDVTYDLTGSIAYVKRPNKFLRLVRFKFSDWINPATKFITQDHPEYKIIENGVIRGGKVNPVVVLIHKDLVRCFACYQVSTDNSKQYLYYIEEGEIEDLDDKVTDALAWLTCAKLMQVFDIAGFEKAADRYKEFMISNMH